MKVAPTMDSEHLAVNIESSGDEMEQDHDQKEAEGASGSKDKMRTVLSAAPPTDRKR